MDVLRRWLVGHPARQGVVVSIFVLCVYLITRNGDNPYNQYVLLADAFAHGRLHLVDPPAFLELARFDGRAYVIDPPAPTLFLLPLVVVFGTNVSHVLVSCFVGAAALGFYWVAARRLFRDTAFVILITTLIAFGTDFWWIASDGGFWSFAHTSAVFFLGAALAEAVGKRRPWLAGLLVGLAGLSRLATFLLAPLYLYLVCDGDLRIRRETVERVLRFGASLGLTAVAYVMYNIARFGTLADRGYYHPQYLDEPWFERGRFDITYVPRHLRAIFIELPARIDAPPYVVPRYIGLALVITTPAVLYAFRTRLERRTIAALVGLLCVCCVLFTHGAVGFSQFGYRFALDLLPAMVILIASGMRERVTKLGVAAVGASVLVNLWG
ncbi:MAG: hypothetical protein WD826_00330, partial [Actinomycetota bacterium]